MGDPRVKVAKPAWLVAQENGQPYSFKRAAPRRTTDPGIETGYSARLAGLEPPIDHGPDPHKDRSFHQTATAARLLLESS
jgi:hypothetical protein